MKVGERGQITIPKDIRERFGIRADSQVDFQIVNGMIVLQKTPQKMDFDKWSGRLRGRLEELGYDSTDQFIEDIRGR
jgi:AbrB family looped-hinge helix DNA binding protein